MNNIEINHLLFVLMYYQLVTSIDHNGMDYKTMNTHYMKPTIQYGMDIQVRII